MDGFIADENGGLEWLDMVPNPNNEDMGYYVFMDKIDALVMGRTTFETVIGFDVDWPYKKPVFVLSSSLGEIPNSHQGKAFLVNGTLEEVLEQIHSQGHHSLYIDGGKTIQGFLKEDLIDELIITVLPVLLGGGFPLFGSMKDKLEFELIESKVHLGQLVQLHYKRKRG